MKHWSLTFLILLLAHTCPLLVRAQTIPNPGFEENSYAGNPGWVFPGRASQNGGITGWSSNDAQWVGLNNASGPFADNGDIPQGSTVAFLQSTSNHSTELFTTISGLITGKTYNLRFRANARNVLYSNPDYYPLLTVHVDGAGSTFPVGPLDTVVGLPHPYRSCSVNFTAAGTTAQLKFIARAPHDGTVLLDALTVSALNYNPWKVENWTGDGALRIWPESTLWVYRFGTNLAETTVNGVTVGAAVAYGTAAVAGRFSFSPVQTVIPPAINNNFPASGGSGSRLLAEKYAFVENYSLDNATGATLQVQGLTPQTRYTLSLYCLSQRPSADHPSTQPALSISSGADLLSVQPEGFQNAVRVDYSFNTGTGTTRNIVVKSLSNYLYATVSAIALHKGNFEVLAVQGTAPGSLAAVLQEAASAPGPDVVTFVQNLSGIHGVVTSEILVNDPDGVTVDATSLPFGTRLDGGTGTNRLLRNEHTSRLTIRGMSFTSGHGGGPGNFPDSGGAICNQGNLTLERCTFSGNSVTGSNRTGSAILSSGALTMINCTVAENASNVAAIALRAQVGVGPASAANIRNCTIANNAGGGIWLEVTARLTLQDSIVRHAGSDFNALSTIDGQLIREGVNLVNTAYVFGASSGPAFLTAEPALMPLGQYGGGTQTMPPMLGSPALNVITHSMPSTDQRGVTRLASNGGYLGGAGDAGAVEMNGLVPDHWVVREYLSPTPLNNIDQAEALMANTLSALLPIRVSRTVNFTDPENAAPGYFANDVPFAMDNTAGTVPPQDDSDFALHAVCAVRVETTGEYTFGFACDDGARLRISGANFDSSTRLNPENSQNPAHLGNTLTFPGITARCDTLGVVTLRPGIYLVEFTWFERAGGAGCEVFTAAGAKTAIDSSFRLLGQPLPRASYPTTPNPWKAGIKMNVSDFTRAVNTMKGLWDSQTMADASLNSPAINFSDPENGGGGHGQPQTPFPGNTSGDDNQFAFGARNVIHVPEAGWYTFCILADDSARFELIQSRGWTNPNQDQGVRILPQGIEFSGCCRDVLASVYLEERAYSAEFIMNEMQGQAYAGLWVAPGLFKSFDASAFTLLGAAPPADPALSMVTIPSGPPVNDLRANALPLAGSYCPEVRGWNAEATVEAGEAAVQSRSLWWKWTAPGSGWLVVERGNSASLAQSLGVFIASSPTAFMQFLPGGTPGSIQRQMLQAGADLHIAAGGILPANQHTSFNLRFIPASATVVSTPQNPLLLPSNRSVGVSGDTTCVITPHSHAPYAVWYRWTAPMTGSFLVRLDSRFHLQCSVFTVNEGQPAVAAGTEFTLSATSGTTYSFAVHSLTASTLGTYSLIIQPLFDASGISMTRIDNTLRLTWHGELGSRYEVQRSSDLQGWLSIGAGYGPDADMGANLPISQGDRSFFRIVRDPGREP